MRMRSSTHLVVAATSGVGTGLTWLNDDDDDKDVAVVTEEKESVEDEVVKDDDVDDELLDDIEVDVVVEELSVSPLERPSFCRAALRSLPEGFFS